VCYVQNCHEEIAIILSFVRFRKMYYFVQTKRRTIVLYKVDSANSKLISYMLKDRRSIPDRDKNFSLRHHVQTDS
jgi:hypothetical protein